jgi:UDP-glucose 4-epimerase
VLRFYREHHGIESRIFRIANPYGDASKIHTAQGVIDAFLHRVRGGQPLTIWGDGSAVRDFIFADDVATAMGLLLERGTVKPGEEVVNVGSGRGASIAEVVEIIRSVVGQQVTVTRLDGYRGPSHAVLDTGKLRALTGWTPIYDLEKGIREAWRRLMS